MPPNPGADRICENYSRVTGYPAPHLHTHVVVFNMTRTEDGRVRSVQLAELYQIQSYLTAVYQNELAIRLKELGYELTPGTDHGPDIKALMKEYLDAESQRSNGSSWRNSPEDWKGAKRSESRTQAVRTS